MCYVCRQPLDPSNIYAHFVGQGGVADGRRYVYKDPTLSDLYTRKVQPMKVHS